MENAIQIKNLTFSYDTLTVLENVSLSIKKNQFVAIVGENGTGKTTLLNLILGNIKGKGEIFIFNKNIKEYNNYKKIAYISQNAVNSYKYFPTTVEEVIKSHLKQLKSKMYIHECLELMKLTKHRKNSLSQLSGGQLQRVAILLALIKEAELIILDEATSGVDKKFSAELFKELKKLSLGGKTILLVTHHINEAIPWVDKIIKVSNKTVTYIDKSSKNGAIDNYGVI